MRSRSDAAQISVGDFTRVRQFVEVNAKGDPVTMGEHCFIAKDAWIGGYGAIRIGSNTMIGIRSIVVSSDHDYIHIETPYYDGSEVPKPISIGDNVWVGSNCVILGGSTIGSGSVVGAGSVVCGVFPANSLIVGVPAKAKQLIDRSV